MVVGMLVFGVAPLAAHAQELITSYKTDIVINADASARVTEAIAYDFGAVPLSGPQARHGIVRTIPLTVPQSNTKIALSDMSVTDAGGAPIPFTDTIADNTETIRIGDPNSTVTGAHTYVISYTVRGGVRYFSDHDEWYWNAVGDQWPVAVRSASATVSLPLSPLSTAPTSTCYTGIAGSRDRTCTARVIDGAHAVFAITRPLAPDEAFTIVVGFSKNIVAYMPPITAVAPAFRQPPLAAWGGLLDALMIGGAILFILYARKKRFSRPGSPIPQYTPPENVSPIEAAALAGDPTRKGLVAQIVSLAARGYMTIQYIENRTLGVFKTNDFSFARVSAAPAPTNPEDAGLLDIVFPGGATTMALSDLSRGMGKMAARRAYANFIEQAYAQLMRKGYLTSVPRRNAGKYVLIGLVALFVAVPVLFIVFGPLGGIGAFIAVFVVLAGMPWTMMSATPQGRELFWYIEGLKLYISVAEKNRIAFHDAPEKNPKHFQDLLPYAIALGVEKKWAQKFDGLFTSDEFSWYQGQYAHASPSVFAGSLSGAFASSFLNATGFSGSGPSGFSGGAGAGGGGGGGGGGSW